VEVQAHTNSCSLLYGVSSVDTEHKTVKIRSVTDFFYDDPNAPYIPLPQNDLDQSPCYPIIAIRQGCFYCRFHPEIKNAHLHSIKHHIKYKDPEVHNSELLKFPKLTHG
jgi:hypothetical protein